MRETAAETIYGYDLYDPRIGRARYVGITLDLKKRLDNHLTNTHSEPLRVWFAELKQAGVKPKIRILFEEKNWERAREKETRWIKTLSSTSGDLLNVTDNPFRDASGNKPGPARKYAEKIVRYSISLPPTQADRLKHLGEGNLSLGIRRALALSMEPGPSI